MSIKLSKRLQAICDMVPGGSVVCDVGCDHAHVDIYLLQEKRIERALAMDVADGPLEIARQNLSLVGLEAACEIRKSNGLEKFEPGDADALIIAGMGGILMESILENAEEKPRSFRQLILSPHSEPWVVRDWLMRNDYGITDERLIEEDGKFYPILYCVPGAKTRHPLWDALAVETAALPEEKLREARVDAKSVRSILTDPEFQHMAEIDYGPCLIADQDKTLHRYIVRTLKAKIEIFQTLRAAPGSSQNAAMRLQEIQSEIGMLQILLFIFHYLE